MKKEVIFFCFILPVFFILNLSFLSADLNSTEQQKRIDNAYTCLNNKTSGNCGNLSVEEQAFTLLAINQCQVELLNSSKTNSDGTVCWSNTIPASACKLKTTSQAVLALHNFGSQTGSSETWLLNQNKTASGLDWFLEIESSNFTTCKIQYATTSSGTPQTYNVNIGADKKISDDAGLCLTRSQDNYWLKVAPSCYNKDISVSCNQSFLTALLFQKQGTTTVNVFNQVNSAAANGKTTQQVKSLCFAESGVCNYEGSLWATLTLSSLGYDVSAYMPYLISFSTDDINQRFLPDSFLYFLTADPNYRASLLSEQQNNNYWLVSGDKFYDTALALYPLQNDDSGEKTNAEQWLLTSQDSNGCWQNNIRNTAFILASAFPKSFSGGGGGGGGLLDCTTAGYYCSTSGQCTSVGGSVLSSYSCIGGAICCSKQPAQVTCAGTYNGIICNSNQNCVGGSEVLTSDLGTGQTCCISGSCQLKNNGNVGTCESNGGICRTTNCQSNETLSTTYTCTDSSNYCCIPQSTGGGGNGGSNVGYTWVWVLLILVILVAVAIVFREKLKYYISKLSSGFGKGKASQGPGRPPSFPPSYPMMPRRIPLSIPRPQLTRPSPTRTQVARKSGAQQELDEVLKKLKDMSK